MAEPIPAVGHEECPHCKGGGLMVLCQSRTDLKTGKVMLEMETITCPYTRATVAVLPEAKPC